MAYTCILPAQALEGQGGGTSATHSRWTCTTYQTGQGNITKATSRRLHFPKRSIQWGLLSDCVPRANAQWFLVVGINFDTFCQLKNLSLVRKNKNKETKQTMATETPGECNDYNKRQSQCCDKGFFNGSTNRPEMTQTQNQIPAGVP